MTIALNHLSKMERVMNTALPSTLTRARRVSDREGSAAQTMTTTTSSELELVRRNLAALDADIARLQVHFTVALQPLQQS